MCTVVIDLNSDLGEGIGDDASMLDIVTSANIACGFHAGEPHDVLATLQEARARGVAIGAHVSYDDPEGFGRVDMDVPSGELIADLVYQIGALQALAGVAGARVTYLKPHGALYNRIVHDERQARDVVTAVTEVDPSLVVLGLPGSSFLRAAEEAGLAIAAEAFADRAYTPQGTLVPRSASGSVLHDPRLVAERMLRLVDSGVIEAIDGTYVSVRADSLCVHGDSPGATAMARAVQVRLQEAGIEISSFVQASQ